MKLCASGMNRTRMCDLPVAVEIGSVETASEERRESEAGEWLEHPVAARRLAAARLILDAMGPGADRCSGALVFAEQQTALGGEQWRKHELCDRTE